MFKNTPSFHVLYTTDVEGTHNFYKSLGLQINEVAEDKVVLVIGSYELHFILNTTEPVESYRSLAIPGSYGQGIIFYLESDDIDSVQTAVTQAGGTIKAPRYRNHWGADELLFIDPNGYAFAVYQLDN